MRRLWKAVFEHIEQGLVSSEIVGELNAELKTLRRQLHQTIEKITDDYARRHSFNTAIASVMELMNALAKIEGSDPQTRALRQESLEAAVFLLSPIVPHISEALWAELRPGSSILDANWPSVDSSALVQDEIELVIQVNGKLRGSLTVSRTTEKAEIEKLAVTQACVQKYLEDGATVRKSL